MEYVANKLKTIITDTAAGVSAEYPIYAQLEDDLTSVPCVVVTIENVDNTENIPCHYDGELNVMVYYHGKDNGEVIAKQMSKAIRDYLLTPQATIDLNNAGLTTIAITDEGAGVALAGKSNNINYKFQLYFHVSG